MLFSPRRTRPARRRLTFDRLEDRTVPALVVGPAFPVSAPGGAVFDSATAGARNGLAVVVWTRFTLPTEESDGLSSASGRSGFPERELRAQRFNVAGRKLGPEIVVATDVDEVDVAMDDRGNFVVAWSAEDDDGDGNRDVFAQRFSAAGARRGGPITVAARAGDEFNPHVAMDAVGNFVVLYQTAWESERDQALYGNLYTAQYLADGRPYRPLTVFGSAANDFVLDADIARAPDGRFTVAYSRVHHDYDGEGEADTSDLYVVNFGANGLPRVTETALRGVAGHFDVAVSVDDRANAAVAVGHTRGTVCGCTAEALGVYAVRVNSTGGRSGWMVIAGHGAVLSDVAVNYAGGAAVVAWGQQMSAEDGMETEDVRLTGISPRNAVGPTLLLTRENTDDFFDLYRAAGLGRRAPGQFLVAYPAYRDGDLVPEVFGHLGTL